jgi:subtilisin family serine protease
VVLDQQAALSGVAAIEERDRRLQAVYDRLRATALRSQAPLRAELEAAGASYRPFFIVNMLLVRGDRALLTRLAGRPAVAHIVGNPRVRQALPAVRATVSSAGPLGSVSWGVQNVQAVEVWSLGYTGTGIVVAGADTGYWWDHPALIRQYRGYNGITATHDYHWHDAVHAGGGTVCPEDSPVPCDGFSSSHGTHTMGTMVGDDGAGQQIGVAPGARWIGCRNMDSNGYGTPARYAECFEFFLAPYPIGGDPFADGVPSLAPHVVNNSWSCTSLEGCSGVEITQTLQPAVEVLRAAGIVVVASAGNDGVGGCSTVREPIAIYEAAFTVGATDAADAIAGFSSRGPVTVDGSGRLKPDVSAPGVSVLSSVRDGYGSLSGTSMAGPHVAGTVALLWSAAPRFVGRVALTEQVIERTARSQVDTTCGGAPGGVPNDVYGWGVVDALAAVQRALGTQWRYLPLVWKG